MNTFELIEFVSWIPPVLALAWWLRESIRIGNDLAYKTEAERRKRVAEDLVQEWRRAQIGLKR